MLWQGTKQRIIFLCVAGLLLGGASIAPAAAFDFFGLFGGDDDPPPPSQDALPYSLNFVVAGENKNLVQTLKDASTLQSLQGDPPPDAPALAQRISVTLNGQPAAARIETVASSRYVALEAPNGIVQVQVSWE